MLIAGSQAGAAERSDLGFRPPELSGVAERIEYLLECARRGDVRGYVNSFCGAFRARLEQRVEELGPDAFANELRRFGQLKKGHTVFAAEPDDEAVEIVRIAVETIFPDRNERQTYRLKRCLAEWFVIDVGEARDLVPKNVVGSWATFREPEGVPVF